MATECLAYVLVRMRISIHTSYEKKNDDDDEEESSSSKMRRGRVRLSAYCIVHLLLRFRLTRSSINIAQYRCAFC